MTAMGALGRAAGGALDHAALTATVFKLGLSPDAWRRPARMEFARAVDRIGVGSAPLLALIGAGLGAGLMAQAIRVLRGVGEEGLVRGLLLGLLLEDVAPLVAGLALLGRGGLAIHAELAATRRAGGFRALDAMGIDPLAMLVTPRCLGAAVSGAALSVILAAAAMVSGYAAAETQGFFAPGALLATLRDALTALGPAPLVLCPLKGALYALASAVAFSRAAIEAEGEDAPGAAFRNALIGFLLIAFLFAAAR
ncbi:MAG: hypothetical protein EA355_02050 [Rhodobacteraceae bacterium]|nr:MAG: hypothetical protein EA355_02050 [Paracoccaceae bacterium]